MTTKTERPCASNMVGYTVDAIQDLDEAGRLHALQRARYWAWEAERVNWDPWWSSVAMGLDGAIAYLIGGWPPAEVTHA